MIYSYSLFFTIRKIVRKISITATYFSKIGHRVHAPTLPWKLVSVWIDRSIDLPALPFCGRERPGYT